MPSARASPPRWWRPPRPRRPPPPRTGPPPAPSRGSPPSSSPRSSAPQGSRCCGSSPTSTAPTASPPRSSAPRSRSATRSSCARAPRSAATSSRPPAGGSAWWAARGWGSTTSTSPPPPSTDASSSTRPRPTPSPPPSTGIALLTAMARNIAQADASLKAGKWMRNKYVGVSLVGKTLAILGFGKVGSEVARRAKGLGMHVIAHDPYASADRARAIGVELVGMEEAMTTADFISLHMPLTPATNKMLNDEAFAKMKKGVRIINVARGGVIDEDALVRALDAGIVAQAALDVFTKEPPAPDSKLVLHENVTVTPHLGASTVEAQEGVAIEIAEAVIGALKGELAASAVNAPMVPAEVLSELAPYVVLAEKLGRLAVQLVAGGGGIKSVKVTYASARAPDDLDTRLLRAMITKGLIEPISSVFVNLVNADFTAKQRGVRITEERILLDGSPETPIDYIQVQISNVESKFPSAIAEGGEITVEGRVKDGIPHLTKVGAFQVDVSLEGSLILCRQVDQPGMIGSVGSVLGEENVNVSFMSVGRLAPRKHAVMAIGVDEEPSKSTLTKIGEIPAIEEFVFLKL
ncbi:hypothetical protein EJB05_39926 [Eragrostis curvula]|uniref:phosphoglycerate dehydrogenase n=1 Tax=Eragrostis curvula TaxID=38414 RepID=A0A5J9TYV8_9POAL|nr:hypothetical protein EJB05_39926 [Eragrostis curvula]